MKIKVGDLQSDFLTLDRKKLEKRFEECARFTGLVHQLRCGLDNAAYALMDPMKEGARRVDALRGLDQALRAAVAIKESFGIAEDRTAYALEKAARDISKRLARSPDPAVNQRDAARALASVRLAEAKIKAMVHARKDRCGIRAYESVKVERQY